MCFLALSVLSQGPTNNSGVIRLVDDEFEDTEQGLNKDYNKGDFILKRMLKTPPNKSRTSKESDKIKQDGAPGKKNRPAKNRASPTSS